MKCSLNAFNIYFALAVALLALAVVLATQWPTALPLFGAAAAIGLFSYVVIPKMKQALLDYATCRGPSIKCSLNLTLNNLGQVTAVVSVVSFALAGTLQIAALAFIYSVFLAWLGVATSAAVAFLVKSGVTACGVALAILLGVQANAWSFKRCMDEQDANVGGAGPLSPGNVS